MFNLRQSTSGVLTVAQASVPASGTKRALLIGVNYVGTDYALNGCHNDVQSVAQKLGKDYKITMMIDDSTSKLQPTRAEIIKQMHKLVAKTDAGDVLYVHYSGHGSNTKDSSGDERDGKDETICALDGDIVDDELYEILVAPLVQGAKLRVVFDCCHSGSGLDLPFRYTRGAFYRENDHVGNQDVVMISGCRDEQTSADAYIGRKYQGALTWAIMKTIAETRQPARPTVIGHRAPINQQSDELNWTQLIDLTRETLRKGGYSQVPQVSFMRKDQAREQANLGF